MSILNNLLPGSWIKGKDSSDSAPAKEVNIKDKGWFAALHRFNDHVAQLVVFNSKILVFFMLVFFVYLLFASVTQEETFSIRQLNVHPSLEAKGYNSGFIAKKISYNIASLVNEVPDKLVAMFSSTEGTAKNEILYTRIMGKYLKKEIKIDFDVDVGGINLPLHDLTKTARGLLGVEDKTLDGDITVEDSLIIMTIGFNSKGINKSYQSKKYMYVPRDTINMIDVIDSMTFYAAKFVLKQYDPLVTLLIDYNPREEYSAKTIKWHTNIYTETERLHVLKEMYLNEKKDKELAIWAHAISGAFYSEKHTRHKENPEIISLAIHHFEKAVEMDASFIDIVGFDLANMYSKTEDDNNKNNVIKTYKKMIKSAPGNIQIHFLLLTIYSDQNNMDAYFKELEAAFQNGLYITEASMEWSIYTTFKNQAQFKALVKKYNEKNKPLY
ncbi:MAG: hypothetical protein Q8M08_03305 [Bacteroidales bacterium]|nr:hypothetical protein [Bacteroidales bacterium]